MLLFTKKVLLYFRVLFMFPKNPNGLQKHWQLSANITAKFIMLDILLHLTVGFVPAATQGNQRMKEMRKTVEVAVVSYSESV